MKFNETKSQERLINLMLQAGVEWPEGATHVMQSGLDGYILFSNGKPERSNDGWCYQSIATPVPFVKPLPNWHQTIVVREQFEARDGWITWHGGECPVDGFDFEATRADGVVIGGDKVTYWGNEEGVANIIAYRPNKPTQSEPCESVKSCIPDQQTIEQLIAEWKQKDALVGKEECKLEAQQSALDAAKRDADEAKKSVDDALLDAGYFVGGSVVEAEQPTITDWRDLRVGDVVQITWSDNDTWKHFSGIDMVVDSFTGDDSMVKFSSVAGHWYLSDNTHWKFIRRP